MDEDDALCWRAERACALAWPAVEERRVGDWIVRRSGGGTKRTNSASAVAGGAPLGADTLAEIASLYRAQEQPTILRLTSLSSSDAVSGPLDGFAPAEGVTHTLAASLDGTHRSDPTVMLAHAADAGWIAERGRISRALGRDAHDHVTPLARLAVPAIFARVGAPTVHALGYVALVDDLAVVEAVATDPAQHRRGRARACVSTLLAAAHAAGARTAVLQVGADNTAALALYARLGFTHHLYDYHYRRSLQ